MNISSALRSHKNGTVICVRVNPKSSRDEIDGWIEDGAGRVYLKVQVRAVPENGAANKAVCQVMAKTLGVPKSSVSVVSGDASRIKQVLALIKPDRVLLALSDL